MRPFNFSPGPATLPEEVLAQARDELLDWQGSGASVMEVSHRGAAFSACAAEAEADLRALMSIPADYRVLFLQGGATGQFAAIPLNLATTDSVADYVDTGHWSRRAMQEAQRYCRVHVAADAAGSDYRSVPPHSPAGAPRRAPPTCTTRPTRPSVGWSFRSCRRWKLPWSPTCPRRSCHGPSTSAAMG